MTPAGYAVYKNVAASMSYGKEKLLVMVYEGAVRFTREAREGIVRDNVKMKGENISKVLALVTELDCALDRETGGELVDNLSSLYDWIRARLTHANIRNDSKALEEVERIFVELLEGFQGAAEQTRRAALGIPVDVLEPVERRGINVAV